MGLLAESIAAHGGMERWRSIGSIRLHLSAHGLAFDSRGQGRAFRDVTATVSARGQRVEFHDFPHPGSRGIWSRGEATIEDGQGVVARSERWTRSPRWKPVDAVAFGGAALWTYVAFPFVLWDEGFEVRELPRRRLHVKLRHPLAAHAREHVLHLDRAGRIRRQDYTAEAFGPLARAANTVLEHGQVGGIVIGTRRLVTPRAFGRALPGPALVRIALSPAAEPAEGARTGP